MAQSNLKLVQPTAATTWPDSNDVTDLLAIVEAQTETIADQAILIDRYQSVLNTAQAATPAGQASGTGSGVSTNLTVSGVTGIIKLGSTVSVATGVPAGTTIVSQTSGPLGGAGVYVTNQATTASNAALTFTPPAGTATGLGTGSGTALTVTGATGAILLNSTASGAGIPAGTTVTAQPSGTPGGNGVYTTSVATTATGGAVAFTPPPPKAASWPVPQDPVTLMQLTQNQTAVIRTQTALLQHYQETLNTSQTPGP